MLTAPTPRRAIAIAYAWARDGEDETDRLALIERRLASIAVELNMLGRYLPKAHCQAHPVIRARVEETIRDCEAERAELIAESSAIVAGRDLPLSRSLALARANQA